MPMSFEAQKGKKASTVGAMRSSRSHASPAPDAGWRPLNLSDRSAAPGVLVQRKCACGGGAGATIECAECENKGGVLQRKGVEGAVALGVQTPSSRLPYLERIQQSFGQHDIGRVEAHLGKEATSSARALQAWAYTTGNDVVFAGVPSLHTAAHEAAHVVQQRGGVQLAGGIGQAGDPYEQHADAVAERVLSGQSAEGLLGRFAGAGAETQAREKISEGKNPYPPIQRKPDPQVLARADKLKSFRAYVKTSDWNNAALTLNGLNQDDIDRLLAPLALQQRKAIRDAALEVLRGWPEIVTERVNILIAEGDRVQKLKDDYAAELAKARATSTWDRVAELLNGFSLMDINSRLAELSLEELKKLDEVVETQQKGWSDHLHTPLRKRLLGLVNTEGAAPGTASRPPSEGAFNVPPDKRSELKWKSWLDTRDTTARTLGAVDYQDYVRNVLVGGGAVLGGSIPSTHPVHPVFLNRLERATNKARALLRGNNFGVGSINGQDSRPGNHAWGLAVDIDAAANPYIANEMEDKGIDELTTPVYERIAQALLHRASVIAKPSRGKSNLEGATWTQVAEESDAMMAYFGVLRETKSGEEGKNTTLPPKRPQLTGRTFAQEALGKLDRETVRADYNLLRGKSLLEGEGADRHEVPLSPTNRKARKISGDFPFEGAGAGTVRDPSRGFLTLKEEVVQALQAEKLRWGATDFPGASGDVMHFDMSLTDPELVAWSTEHKTPRRQEEERNHSASSQ